jgi:tetratricopeptide (TPR) repeat protein
MSGRGDRAAPGPTSRAAREILLGPNLANFVKKPDWQGATDVYEMALKQYPKDTHLTTNAVATWDRWAKTYFPPKDWAAAIKTYEKALKQFPNDSTLKNNLEYCKNEME